jgi:hypothetical protein
MYAYQGEGHISEHEIIEVLKVVASKSLPSASHEILKSSVIKMVSKINYEHRGHKQM